MVKKETSAPSIIFLHRKCKFLKMETNKGFSSVGRYQLCFSYLYKTLISYIFYYLGENIIIRHQNKLQMSAEESGEGFQLEVKRVEETMSED